MPALTSITCQNALQFGVEASVARATHPSDLAGGISWTLTSGAAADFAILNPYHAGHRSQSGAFNCVVRRSVGRRDVLAHFYKRGENEVILFPAVVGTWTIDGGYNDVTKHRRPSIKQQRAWKESADAWRARPARRAMIGPGALWLGFAGQLHPIC